MSSFPKIILTMGSPETSALNRLLDILNTILGFVGQDLDVRNISNPRFNPFTLANVIVGSVYSTYLLTCMVHMKSLETISEIVWIVPLMIQSVVMSINGQAKYGTALEFIRWMIDLMASTHSVAFIQQRVQLANEKCMKMAKRLFWWVVDPIVGVQLFVTRTIFQLFDGHVRVLHLVLHWRVAVHG